MCLNLSKLVLFWAGILWCSSQCSPAQHLCPLPPGWWDIGRSHYSGPLLLFLIPLNLGHLRKTNYFQFTLWTLDALADLRMKFFYLFLLLFTWYIFLEGLLKSWMCLTVSLLHCFFPVSFTLDEAWYFLFWLGSLELSDITISLAKFNLKAVYLDHMQMH